MKAGDRFEVFAPSANWLIHDNNFAGCNQPVTLNGHGSDTSLFRDNVIERGDVAGSIQAVVVTGRFTLVGNQVAGFDGKNGESSAKP